MNKFCRLLAIVLLFALALSCQSQRMGGTVQPVICDCSSTADSLICYSAIGISIDEMFSKEKAMTDAKIGLAGLLETYVIEVSNRLTTENEIQLSDSLRRVRKNAVRITTQQMLRNMIVSCEKRVVLKDGKYKTFISVSIPKQIVHSTYKDQVEMLIPI